MRETPSFVSAFVNARDLVGRWETREGYENSNPQMEVGADISIVLNALALSRSNRQASLTRDDLETSETASE